MNLTPFLEQSSTAFGVTEAGIAIMAKSISFGTSNTLGYTLRPRISPPFGLTRNNSLFSPQSIKLFRNIPPDLNSFSEAPIRATVLGLNTKSNDAEFTFVTS